MEGIVLDCSMAMSWCFKEERHPLGESLRNRIETGIRVAVPFIWVLETVNVLRMAEKRKRIVPEDTQRYLHWLFQVLPIEIDTIQNPVIVQNWLFQMREYDLTAYDAAYIELAQRRNWPLATLDKKLRKTAISMNILYKET